MPHLALWVASAGLLNVTALAAAAGPAAKPATPLQALNTAKTMEFVVVWYENDVYKAISEASLVKPNMACVVDTDRQRGGIMTVYVSDGKTQTEYRRAGQSCTHSPAPATLQAVQSYSLALSVLAQFCVPAQFRKFARGPSDAKTAQYIRPLGVRNGKMRYEVLAVEAQTGLPQALEITFEKPTRTAAQSEAAARKNGRLDNAGEEPGEERFEFHGWKLNLPISRSKFAYAPPAEAKLLSLPKAKKKAPLTLEDAIKGAVIR